MINAIATFNGIFLCQSEPRNGFSGQNAFLSLDKNIQIEWQLNDGDRMDKNQILCMISGTSRAIISAERVALNSATFSSFNKLADTSPVPMSSFNANATTLSTVDLFMNKIHNNACRFFTGI
jgi:hypothetical protein